MLEVMIHLVADTYIADTNSTTKCHMYKYEMMLYIHDMNFITLFLATPITSTSRITIRARFFFKFV